LPPALTTFVSNLKADVGNKTPKQLLRRYAWHLVGVGLLLFVMVRMASTLVVWAGMGALVCLVVGLINPEKFRALFGAKTSKSSVGWTFGTLFVLLAMVSSGLEPKSEDALPVVASTSGVAPVTAPVEKTADQIRADAAKERASRAQAKAQQAKAQKAQAEKAAEKKRAEKEAKALAQAQTKARVERRARLEREAASLSQRNSVPETASSPEDDSVIDEISDVSSADAWVPDGGEESYRNPRTLKVLLAVQHVGDESGPIVVKVGNNDFSTWGQTTVTLNYDLLASVKKASVVAQLNYFYSFPSLASGQQKTIPITAFRNAEGRAFNPDQYRLRRIFVESKTLEGRKTWDAHPS
jgi:hypothetical protein